MAKAIWIGALALGLPLVAGAAALAWIATTDLRPRAENLLTNSLGRKTTIAGLELGWNGGPTLRLREVVVANLEGGSDPVMLRLASLDADIDVMPLLRGVLQYRRLRVAGLDLLLERLPDGANWRSGGGGGGSIGHIAAVPKDRTEFPTLLDARARDSRVRYRATSGNMITVGWSELSISAPADDQPATLVLAGNYNGTPGSLTVHGASFAVMRQADVPYRAKIAVDMAKARLDFAGTLTNPLDVDGVDGMLTVQADPVEDVLAAFGAAMPARFPVRVEGMLHRQGDAWRLDGARGTLADATFSGTLGLTEGARGQPDAVTATLAFDRLNLTPLLRPAGGNGMSLQLDPAATRVTAEVTAGQLTYRAMRLASPHLRVELRGADAELQEASFGIGGGRVDMRATLGAGGHLAGNAALSGIDLAAVAAEAGAKPGDIGGRLDGRMEFDITGPTLDAALQTGTVQAVVGMTNGRIARAVLELASADLRALLRHAEGSVPVTCLLAVVDAHKGMGRIGPLRLRSADTTLAGAGAVDLARQVIDITIRPEDSGFFALDVPIRIAGPIRGPSIAPAPAALKRAETGGIPSDLAPALRQQAASNPCSRP